MSIIFPFKFQFFNLKIESSNLTNINSFENKFTYRPFFLQNKFSVVFERQSSKTIDIGFVEMCVCVGIGFMYASLVIIMIGFNQTVIAGFIVSKNFCQVSFNLIFYSVHLLDYDPLASVAKFN